MKLFVSSAPHITGKDSSRSIMRDVIIAMVPAIIASGVIFGLRAILLIAVTAVRSTALGPKITPEAITAGIIAMITSSIIERLESLPVI